MSLIDREALIAEYDRVHVGAPGGARKLMVDAPEVKPEQQWIPCSERLPEEAQECWIATKDGTVGQGMFTKRYGERRGSGFICYGCGFAWLNAVVAWMPYQLPEPYQEGR